MSERWKTALKFGLLWGILMLIFSALFDLQEKTLSEIVNSGSFWLRSLVYTLVGIFPVGYFSAGKKQAN
ncbi:hypothetical protein HUK80_10230 [Flavobacterium sp. MAH-1]|uniref:Uncharacterized protein n=1 Tax=Flavobacterium agri TaxID=2743471 RepID=A0A7Y9C7F1_9FLAO|nr:hypothetical protein [Flavobacterium agri]NUY81273.1 hypothetical protein [Flavobacterium agri]NYA71297.1 hypothetical protein [Flavobacterium agri]